MMIDGIHWLTPCECGNQETFEILKARESTIGYIVYAKCPKCGGVNKFRLMGDDIENVLKDIPVIRLKKSEVIVND